jgi:anti-sigma factor RsiW
MSLLQESSPGHVGELRLRRFRLGELPAADDQEISRHTAECGPCRARLRGLDDEQRHFEREISFERFAGGVERARRVPRVQPRRAWTMGALGFAAAAALLVFVRPAAGPHDWNRTKGPSTLATAHIAGAGGAQRAVAAGATDSLRPGERVRFGYRAAQPAHLVAVSIDDSGAVTALYPERGAALPVEPGREVSYLPDSLEFTGHGRERVFLFLTERPLRVDEITDAARAAHAHAHGDLAVLAAVLLDGRGKVTQFTWLFNKP